jgi:hypothetical protein
VVDALRGVAAITVLDAPFRVGDFDSRQFYRRGAARHYNSTGVRPSARASWRAAASRRPGSGCRASRAPRQGRPALRLAAWRAVWGALKSNPVYAARFTHLTSREHNKLSTGQAHAVLAATLLRHLHAVITSGQRWDPAIATGGRPGQPLIAA